MFFEISAKKMYCSSDRMNLACVCTYFDTDTQVIAPHFLLKFCSSFSFKTMKLTDICCSFEKPTSLECTKQLAG